MRVWRACEGCGHGETGQGPGVDLVLRYAAVGRNRGVAGVAAACTLLQPPYLADCIPEAWHLPRRSRPPSTVSPPSRSVEYTLEVLKGGAVIEVGLGFC